MHISGEKWLVMGLLAVISILLGLIPFWIFSSNYFKMFNLKTSNSLGYKVPVTILTSFGGGVLLATALIHMLPEGREALLHVSSFWEKLDVEFPLAEILVLVGFLLIYVIEEIAHFLLTGNEDDSKKVGGSGRRSMARHNSIAHSLPLRRPTIEELSSENKSNYLTVDDPNKPELVVENRNSLGSADPIVLHGGDGDHAHNVTASVRSFLGLLALSFHGIMEGIAVGIQQANHVWVMFGAVASHKFIISFCMGLEMYNTKARTGATIASVVFFGVISSVGILIGTVLSDAETETSVIAVLKNLATGTLLYVIFFEILNREREKRSQGDFKTLSRTIGFIQFLSFLIGIILMTILITSVGHTHHEHGEEDCHDHQDESTTHDPAHEHSHFKVYNYHKKLARIPT